MLKIISFEVHKGEIIALTGESGQGKSTVLQLLQKFYSPEAGSILLNHRQLQEVNTIDYRKLVGVVPQDIMIFSGTVVDNICFETTERVVSALQSGVSNVKFEKQASKRVHNNSFTISSHS